MFVLTILMGWLIGCAVRALKTSHLTQTINGLDNGYLMDMIHRHTTIVARVVTDYPKSNSNPFWEASTT